MPIFNTYEELEAFKKRAAELGAPFVEDDDPIFKKGASIHFLGRDTDPEPEEEKPQKE